MMHLLDRQALRQGAGVALVFAVPFSLLARWAADADEPSPWVLPLVLLALGGFTIGGGVAAWLQRTGAPLLHGIVCAAATYLAAQAVFVAIKLLRGGEVSWLGVLFNLTAVVFAGAVGGALGSALQRRGIMPRQTAAGAREGEGGPG